MTIQNALHAGLAIAAFGESYAIQHNIQKLGRGFFGVVYKVDNYAVKVVIDMTDSSSSRIYKHIRNGTLRSKAFPKVYAMREVLYPWGAGFVVVLEILNPSAAADAMHVGKIAGDSWYCDPPKVRSSERRLRSALRHVKDAVAQLKRHGFFPNDIKPSNIMRRRDGQIVLTDVVI